MYHTSTSFDIRFIYIYYQRDGTFIFFTVSRRNAFMMQMDNFFFFAQNIKNGIFDLVYPLDCEFPYMIFLILSLVQLRPKETYDGKKGEECLPYEQCPCCTPTPSDGWKKI